VTSWADETGSITVGKWADFAILDARLPASVDRALENRQVTAIYLAGKRVYPKQEPPDNNDGNLNQAGESIRLSINL
jgi:imidazolonepropionase-like amidohydrolase